MKIASNIMKAVNLCLVLARASTSAQCRRLGWTRLGLCSDAWVRIPGEKGTTQGRMGGGTGFLSVEMVGAVQLR
jgi:hypothetical protein